MIKNPVLEGIARKTTSFFLSSLAGRKWDWQITALTIALVQISSTRLVITEWVPALDITEKVSFYAVILGLVLGYSSFTRKNVIWTAVEYGLLLIPMQLLSTTDHTGNYYNDYRDLFSRLFNSFGLFFRNLPVNDTIFFVLLTSICFWIVGIYSGYQLTKNRNFLNIVLAPGLIILIVQIYDAFTPLRVWGLAVYIFVALILLGRLYYLDNKASWKKKRVFLSSDAEWEFLRSAFLTAGLVVFIAWGLPGVLASVKPAAEVWQNFTDPILKRLSDAVSALDAPYGSATSADFYGTDLKLGSSAPVSDEPVFYVKVEHANVDIPRYYWRGRVYNQYDHGQWSNANSSSQSFDPTTDKVLLADSLDRTEVDFRITMNFPNQELLYGPSEMIWVNRESRMMANPFPENAHEVTAWFADPGLIAGDKYEVHALIANPTIQDLQASGNEYPEWVTQNYLQVPQDLEPQLRKLAESITASHSTPYDKTQAVTSFLRNDIEYETEITETPPHGKDPLLWVLLDYKKGFCMYYASAEVLLLRTLGIPARMAVGFAEGEYDEQAGRYTVARLNSHAWPEVYFPQIGWVEFEPTANQVPLDRPQKQIGVNSEAQANAQINPPVNQSEAPQSDSSIDQTLKQDQDLSIATKTNPWERLLLPGLFLFFLGTAAVLIRRYSLTERLPVYLVERYTKNGSPSPRWLSNWANWAKLLPIERAFQAINLGLRWLGETQPSYITPSERAQSLAKSLPSAGEAINDLVREHQTALFTPRSANLKLARRASLKVLLEAGRIRIFRYKENLKRRYN